MSSPDHDHGGTVAEALTHIESLDDMLILYKSVMAWVAARKPIVQWSHPNGRVVPSESVVLLETSLNKAVETVEEERRRILEAFVVVNVERDL